MGLLNGNPNSTAAIGRSQVREFTYTDVQSLATTALREIFSIILSTEIFRFGGLKKGVVDPVCFFVVVKWDNPANAFKGERGLPWWNWWEAKEGICKSVESYAQTPKVIHRREHRTS